MTHLKIIILLLAGLWNIQIIFAQIAPSPFPLTEEQISFKIDSLREVYKPYDEQDFSSLSEAERNKVMIAKGREAILVFAPDYYREYKNPTITIDTLQDEKAWKIWASNTRLKRPIVPMKKEHIGKHFYRIYFSYDQTKENLGRIPFITEFRVLQDTGEPLTLFIPNANSLIDFEKHSFERRMKEKRSPEDRIKYQPYVEGTRTGG